jgi:hypothetical protein
LDSERFPNLRAFTTAILNSIFSGNAKSLLKLKEDDAFIAKVNVSGAVSYSTIGNKTSVPSFAVRDFVKIGTC